MCLNLVLWFDDVDWFVVVVVDVGYGVVGWYLGDGYN